MPDLAIDVRNVVKRYDRHVAVRDLSLAVPRGAVYGLLGPNGAGKTTTIRMILDIIAPDAGTIAVLGGAPSDQRVLDRVGYLPEERGLYKKMTVRRVLRFLAALKGVSGREADRRITAWLERLALRSDERDWGDARVDELSRGMQQKAQFIGALLHEPELVILDEPFSGLDPINAQALKDTVLDLKRQGKTVIFSTHVMDNAERMCDAVCIIAGGAKVLDGPVSAVKAGHGGRHVALAFESENPSLRSGQAPSLRSGQAPSLGSEQAASLRSGQAMDGDAGALDGVQRVLADRALVRRVDDHNRSFDLELADGADPQELLRRLVAAGVPISRFELVQPSLHQIFLDRVGASPRVPGTGAATGGVEAGMTGHG